MKVNEKVVWITGASSGIGEALAYEMAKKGARLILTARTIEKLEEVKNNCGNALVEVLPFDVIEHNKAPDIVRRAVRFFGRIDIFVNNAGISQRATVMETSLKVEKRIMDVNFFGGVALVKALLPTMVEQGAGQLVIMSSVLGKIGVPWRSTYAASKHALHGYFDSLRAELVPYNIKVTVICPGYVNTEVTKHALMGDGSAHNRYSKASQNGYSPGEFAKKAMRVIEKDKYEVVIAQKEYVGILIKRFFPGLFVRLLKYLKLS